MTGRVTVDVVSAYPPPRPPGRGFQGSPPPRRGRAVRVDPVLVELGAGLVWLAVGTLGLGADGVGTLILAVGIAIAIGIGVENRRRGPRPFDTSRSAEMLRLGGGVIAIVIIASIVLGLISASAFLPGLALVLTGGAFVLLSRSTGQQPTRWLGLVVVAAGVLSALVTTATAGGFVSQGLLGLLAGVLMLLSAADRVGLVEMLRDRAR
ncbi:hypothetical protein Acsp06_12150 [Actinomycetospora sp. NBRC 106375]|nr:hypothetical protein Acsp06_12150 [Actinomycetospora sp. NBRC 106375]